MQFIEQAVDGMTRRTIPNDNEDVTEIVDLESEDVKHILQVNIYQRERCDCPWNRGNWIVDMIFRNGQIECLRLPLEMTQESVHKFCKPLLDYIEKRKS